MLLIYRVLKKKELISEAFMKKGFHADASTQARADELSEEEKVIWYMTMLLFKDIFDKAGNYYKFKEKDPDKFLFLNDNRPFYQSMNRVDFTRSYIFEKAVGALKEMTFQDLEKKTGVLIEPKELGNVVRSGILRLTREM